ncbi:MAG TPA: DNA-processing protein DprA [Gemmatimonadaceae bacterium]|nr:DNA-processing protein DprA [Gemmatimonadaceae bacterium]
MGILIVTRGSEKYPQVLEDLPIPPDPLYMLGDASVLDCRSVSIVGTREPTPYGIRTARMMATAFARAGICVVSGMARGVDAIAHRSALETDAPTIAVLGTGIDVPYPAGHADLHRAIAKNGLVVSENGPGNKAHKGAFPKRNRIIAALSPVTIVIEGGHTSGAIITAKQALELGRTVAAVPGPIDSPQSQGTNQLLRDGAVVIATVDDALTLVGAPSAAPLRPYQLSEVDGSVWSALAVGPLTIDSLSRKTSLTPRDCLTAITSLEIQGMVESLLTGEVRRR